jgi:hypothetical protein
MNHGSGAKTGCPRAPLPKSGIRKHGAAAQRRRKLRRDSRLLELEERPLIRMVKETAA